MRDLPVNGRESTSNAVVQPRPGQRPPLAQTKNSTVEGRRPSNGRETLPHWNLGDGAGDPGRVLDGGLMLVTGLTTPILLRGLKTRQNHRVLLCSISMRAPLPPLYR
jgi:hypothetical protein